MGVDVSVKAGAFMPVTIVGRLICDSLFCRTTEHLEAPTWAILREKARARGWFEHEGAWSCPFCAA
jgi:hypothetical protein